ncbi:MAG: HD domain-containing protein [Acetatifactor sp.]|nr:HD domain-containing protein [Acetatifactor sp.]
MTKETYQLLEKYMLSCMGDSAHDKEHIYRVLYSALEIAQAERDVDYDVLICACLLHDVGRREQFDNPSLCHAQVGAEKAYRYLMEQGFEESFAARVRHCILAHRYRNNNVPETIEAKILFDADKLDVTGAIGIARTLFYKGRVSEPLYNVDSQGRVQDGTEDTEPSFFQEYKYKLENIYSHFYTKKGAEMAQARRQAAADYYENLLQEVRLIYEKGGRELAERAIDG